MTTLLPLSPAVTPQIQTTADLQRSLYQLASLPDFGDVRSVLERIDGAVRTAPDECGRLDRLPGLLSGDHADTAQALCQIADTKKGPGLLNALSAVPGLRDTLGPAAAIRVETRGIRAGIAAWSSSLTPEQAASFSPLGALGRIWGGINYWAGLPFAALSGAGGMGLMGWEIANLIASGQFHPDHLAEAGVLLGAATLLGGQRRLASNALTAHARLGTIEHEHVREFFARYRGPFPYEKVDLASLTPNRDILDDIRRSSGPGGPLKISRRYTAQLIHDFTTLGRVAAGSFEEDPSQVLYDRLAQAIGMGTLEKLGWQPVVLHGERLEELRERKRRGRKIIFVANHRSHLDILSIVALLRDFRVRFPAKNDLFKIPVLKDLLTGAHHPRINRGDRQGRYKALLKQAVPLLMEGLSLYVFSEGTRSMTPDRSEEVGMLPFELGAFGVALQFEKGVDVVPVCSYGLGRTLPGDDGQALREGAMINAPVVISIGEFIETEEFTKGMKRNGEAKQMLGNAAWTRVWNELASIQALMNHDRRTE